MAEFRCLFEKTSLTSVSLLRLCSSSLQATLLYPGSFLGHHVDRFQVRWNYLGTSYLKMLEPVKYVDPGH